MEFETLIIQAESNIGHITLNRPQKLNALSHQMRLDLIEAAHWFDRQREVKVVIIKGAGRAFTAGADLQDFPGLNQMAEANEQAYSPREMADMGRVMAEAIEDMRAITIAQVHGHCIGGGVVLVAACDMRIAAENASFSIPEVDLGIPLAWGGIPRLVREIGAARTRELVLTCRPFTPKEALEMGFLNRVVPAEQLETETEKLAALLTTKSSLTLTATKKHVNAVLEGMSNPGRNFADADTLLVARNDPESQEVAARYRKKLGH